MKQKASKRNAHIILTSHVNQLSQTPIEVHWAAKSPKKRGPIVGTISEKNLRNAIGSHGGSYTVYRALSIASGHFPKEHKSDLENTYPTEPVKPQPSWSETDRIVSVDPWGGEICKAFSEHLNSGINIHPDASVFVLDERDSLSEQGSLLPGIGDLGDRIHNTK